MDMKRIKASKFKNSLPPCFLTLSELRISHCHEFALSHTNLTFDADNFFFFKLVSKLPALSLCHSVFTKQPTTHTFLSSYTSLYSVLFLLCSSLSMFKSDQTLTLLSCSWKQLTLTETFTLYTSVSPPLRRSLSCSPLPSFSHLLSQNSESKTGTKIADRPEFLQQIEILLFLKFNNNRNKISLHLRAEKIAAPSLGFPVRISTHAAAGLAQMAPFMSDQLFHRKCEDDTHTNMDWDSWRSCEQADSVRLRAFAKL